MARGHPNEDREEIRRGRRKGKEGKRKKKKRRKKKRKRKEKEKEKRRKEMAGVEGSPAVVAGGSPEGR